MPPAAARAPERVRALDPRLRLFALALLLGAAFLLVALSGSLSAHRVQRWVSGYGVAGPLVFVALSSLLTVALFPGPLLAGASGLLFGTALGTPVSILAATLGAVLAFTLSRRVAGDAVQSLGGARLLRLEAAVSRRGFLSILYLRIAPAVPYTLVNYAAGLTSIRLRAFAAATAIGVAPRAFAYTALGGSFGSLGSPQTVVAIVVLVAMALGGALLARRDLRGARDTRADPAPAPAAGSSSPVARSAAPP
jgi:uncharacterized membrane protein YdjX (TVP38/TMEM64 family)